MVSGDDLLVPVRGDDDFLVAAVAVSVADVNPAGGHDELVVGEVKKLQLRLIRFCMTMSSRFSMTVTHICILMALAHSP